MANYRGDTRPGRLDAADFFENNDRTDSYRGTSGSYRAQVQGSMAMQPEYQEPERRENPYRKERLKREQQRGRRSREDARRSEGRREETHRSENRREAVSNSRNTRQKQARRTIDMAQLKGRFHFFLCAGLVMAGCMLVVIMYIRLFSKTNELSSMRSQLNEIESANKAQIATAENMNMDALYSYATDALGMVDATAETTIQIKVVSQSYTTSNLPVQEIPDSKVTFHWFN